MTDPRTTLLGDLAGAVVPAPTPREPIYYSASQITSFLHCPRQWWWDKIGKYRKPDTPQTIYGKLIHAELERFIQHSNLPPLDKRAKEAVRHVAHLDRARLRVEGEVTFPTHIPGRIFTGFIDLLIADTDEPVIIDYKTMKDLKWAKVEHELIEDVQMIAYAHASIALIPAPDAQRFKLQHIQIQSEKSVKSQAIETVVSREHVEDRWQKYLKVIDQMEVERVRPIKDVTLPKGGYGGVACFKYGECYHIDRCAMIQAGVEIPINPNPPKKEARAVPPICPPDSKRRHENDLPATIETVKTRDLPKEIRKKKEKEQAAMNAPSNGLSAADKLKANAGPVKVDGPVKTAAASYLSTWRGGAGLSAATPPLDALAAPSAATSGPPNEACEAGFFWAQAQDGSWYPRRAELSAAPTSAAPTNPSAILAVLRSKTPAKVAQEAPAAVTTPAETASPESEVVPANESPLDALKRRGRPKGSKNKPKEGAEARASGGAEAQPVAGAEGSPPERGAPSPVQIGEMHSLQQRAEVAEKKIAAAAQELYAESQRAQALEVENNELKIRIEGMGVDARHQESEVEQALHMLGEERDAAVAKLVTLETDFNELATFAQEQKDQIAQLEAEALTKVNGNPVVAGPVLYVDCMPMGRADVVHLSALLVPITEQIRVNTGLDWQLHDFRKGVALLQELARQMPLPTHIALDSHTPAGGVVLEVLMPRATGGVIRRI